MTNWNIHNTRPNREPREDDTQENMQLVNKRRDWEEREHLEFNGVSDVRVSTEVKQGLERV